MRIQPANRQFYRSGGARGVYLFNACEFTTSSQPRSVIPYVFYKDQLTRGPPLYYETSRDLP